MRELTIWIPLWETLNSKEMSHIYNEIEVDFLK